MRFNKNYLKKSGVFLASYAAAMILSGMALVVFLAIFTKDSQLLPEYAVVASLVCFIMGLPFALMGMGFYIFTDMKDEKQKNRLFIIALLLGLTCFLMACLLGGDKFFYAVFSALCPVLVYGLVLIADRKFIK